MDGRYGWLAYLVSESLVPMMAVGLLPINGAASRTTCEGKTMKTFLEYSIAEIAEILANGSFAIGADGITDKEARKANDRVVRLAEAARNFVAMHSKTARR